MGRAHLRRDRRGARHSAEYRREPLPLRVRQTPGAPASSSSRTRMKDFESQLSELPTRSAPANWRADILRNARAAAPEAHVAPWWRSWLTPQPIALAAAWLVIAFLALSTPEESTPPPPATLAQ